jgi:copper transport protein
VEVVIVRFLGSGLAAIAVGLLLLPRLLGDDDSRQRWVVAALATARVLVGFWLIRAIAANVIVDQETLSVASIENFAGSTVVGKAWAATQLLSIIFGLVCVLRAAWRGAPAWLGKAALGLGIAVVASVSVTGHAIDDSLPFYARISFLLHTGAGLIWFGGLIGLVWWMITAHSKPPERALALAQRWSVVAKTAMVLVLISGLALAWENVGNVTLLLATDYGRLLVLKLTLLCGVLLIALSLVQYQARFVAAGGFNISGYGRVAAFEAVLGAGLLFIAGWIATITPAAHEEVLVWPLTYRVSWAATWGYGVAPWNTNWWEAIGAAVLLPMAGIIWVIPAIRKWRRYASPAIGSAGVVCLIGTLSVDAYPETFRDPTVPFTVESVARGYDLFEENCIPCHGTLGEADGPLAKQLPKQPPNLTAPHVATHTLGDIYHWLNFGLSGIMPSFDNLTEDDKWDVIDWLIVLSNTYRARQLSPEGAIQWLVAPDMPLQGPSGERTSLVKLRGAPVLISFGDCAASPSAAAELAQGTEIARATGARHVVVAEGGCAVPEGAFVAAHPKAADLAFSVLNRSFDREFALHIDEAHFLVDRSGYIRARLRDIVSEETAGQLKRDIGKYSAEPVVEILSGHGH